MIFNYTDIDCEQIKEIEIVSRKNHKMQRNFVKNTGLSKFDSDENNMSRALRFPFVKVWFFCTMICDMLEMKDDLKTVEGSRDVLPKDNTGFLYKAAGALMFNSVKPKYDLSAYMRKETGLNMLVLDGKE